MAKDISMQEQMFANIGAWQQSDLSQKEWCRQHDVTYHVFHYWYKRFRDQQAEPFPSSSFVQLAVESASETGCEIIFADGTKIVFPKPVTAQYLKALLF
jgi:hypothetical protein